MYYSCGSCSHTEWGRGFGARVSERAEDCTLWSVGEVRTEELRLNFPKCGLKERRLEK